MDLRRAMAGLIFRLLLCPFHHFLRCARGFACPLFRSRFARSVVDLQSLRSCSMFSPIRYAVLESSCSSGASWLARPLTRATSSRVAGTRTEELHRGSEGEEQKTGEGNGGRSRCRFERGTAQGLACRRRTMVVKRGIAEQTLEPRGIGGATDPSDRGGTPSCPQSCHWTVGLQVRRRGSNRFGWLGRNPLHIRADSGLNVGA